MGRKSMYPSKSQECMHQANPLATSSPSLQSPYQSGDLRQVRVMGASSKMKGDQQVSCCSSTEKVAKVADICCGDRFLQYADCNA